MVDPPQVEKEILDGVMDILQQRSWERTGDLDVDLPVQGAKDVPEWIMDILPLLRAHRERIADVPSSGREGILQGLMDFQLESISKHAEDQILDVPAQVVMEIVD